MSQFVPPTIVKQKPQNCLDNAIELRACALNKPYTGFYLEQLPGITIEELSDVTAAEKQTFTQAWQDIKDRSYDFIKNDFLLKINKKATFNSALQISHPFDILNPVFEVEPKNTLRGLVFDSWFLPDKFIGIHLSDFVLYSQTPVSDVDFYVFDLITGNQIAHIVSDVIEGFNVIPINIKLYSELELRQRWFLCYDASKITTVRLQIFWWGNDCRHRIYFPYSVEAPFPALRDAQQNYRFPTYFPFMAYQSNYGLGFYANFEIACITDALVCRHKNALLDSGAWKNLLATEFFEEVVSSPRLNRYTTTLKENAENNRDRFKALYENSMKATIRNLEVFCEICFECSQLIATRVIQP